MRHRKVVWCAGALLGLLFAAGGLAEQPGTPSEKLTPAQRAKLKERDRLIAQAKAAQQAGKLDEALDAARKVLALEMGVYGQAHEDLWETCLKLAELYEAKGSWSEARRALGDARKVRERLYGAGDWRAADAAGELKYLEVRASMSPAQYREAAGLWQESRALNQQANTFYWQGRYAEALTSLEKLLGLLPRLYPAQQYPEGHPALASSLSLMGLVLKTQGEQAQAERFLRDALAMYLKLYPSDKYPAGHPDPARSLNNLGLLLKERRKLAEAERLIRDALSMQKRLYPTEQYPDGCLDLARSLNNLGLVLRERGELDRAEPLYRDALAMFRKLYPPGGYPAGAPDFASTLNNLGALLWARGQLVQAEPYFRDALHMRQKLYPAARCPGGHPELANSLTNLGSLLEERGELAKAEPFYRDALAMCRKLYPPDKYPGGHPKLVNSLNNLGLLLQNRGQLAQAEPFCRDALAMCRKLYPPEKNPTGHPHLARSLNLMGTQLQARGELSQAEAFYRGALAMFRKHYPPKSYPAGHPNFACTLNNLGVLLWARGELVQAGPFFRDALAMRRKLYPPDKYPAGHPHLANSLHNLGCMLRDRCDLVEADPYIRDALIMWQKLYPPVQYPAGHREVADGLSTLGSLLKARGELARAEAFYRDALAMRRKLYPPDKYPRGHPELASCLNGLGSLLQARGEPARAEPFLAEALAMHQGLLEQFAELSGEIEALNLAASFPLSRDRYLSVSCRLRDSAIVYAAVWQGKGALMRIAARRHDDLLTRHEPRTRELAAELSELRLQLGRLLTQPLADSKEHGRRLAELTERKEALERDIAMKLHTHRPSAAARAPTPNDLRRLLPEGVVFIDFLCYVRFEQDLRRPGPEGEMRTLCYVAFLLAKDQPAVRVELGPAVPIERALRDWRYDIDRPVGARSGDRAAAKGNAERELGRLVWQPLVKFLPTGTETVYLSPDAALTRLPWSALPGRQPGRLLLEDHALGIVPHPLYLLEQLQAKPRSPADSDRLVAYGAIHYDRPPGAPEERPVADLLAVNSDRGRTSHVVWPYLPGTEQELARVLAGAGRRKTLVRRGSQASLAQLVRDLPQARWAHLATHGFFDDQGTRSVLQLRPEDYERARWGERVGIGLRNPLLLSGLVLAGADRKGKGGAETFDPDGGILTGEGLLALPLEHLELAVLSACETGLGDVAGGEGVFGLQRAFHVCGCKNVIASLWKVNDDATAALMALFYHKLWKENKPPLVALREAQLTLYHHPERIPALAKERGLKLDDVVALPAGAEKDPKRPTTGKAPVKLWAAFVLSGAGR
jgi:CHAT domain-containing protein/tetratricopeptide (TPR) repeat protein